MSDKEELLELLEPGDVLLRSADNGIIIYGIHPEADKEEGVSCIDTILVKLDDEKPTKLGFKTLVDKVLNELQISGCKYDFEVLMKDKGSE